ncbi:hypothetical protein [Demequina sp.]|uniref:hypothetical protein n=1 Tax=Demequina sp. TaxID=2050685 RepID=UPI0025BD8595|nr:hypothetical protein [Demequina sp.]
MDPKKLHAELLRSISDKYKERAAVVAELTELRGQDTPDDDKVAEALNRRKAIDAELGNMEGRAADLSAEIAEDELAAKRAAEVHKGAELPEERETSNKVTREEALYRKDQDPKGDTFMRDVALAFTGSTQARERLGRHTEQLFDERANAGAPVHQRIVASSGLSGWAVPTYLVDEFAPNAKKGANFVENCRKHPLPESGLTAYLSKVTTGTSADEQAAEGDTVDETDIDDTLISIPIYTVAGSQTTSRQLIDRAPGALDVTMEDLVRSYYTDADNKAINRASTGLNAVATVLTYTDASPTAQEFYSKILQAGAAVETAKLDQDSELLVLLHNTRWLWLQNQFVSTWPFIAGRMSGANGQGAASGAGYGPGIRGYLPSDYPVITDNNIVTNLGAGTNQDRAYVLDKNEAHVWVDDSQPLLIKAEQTQAKKLAVDFVVYGYQANCFNRYSGAVQAIDGTGLVTPAF